VLEELGQGFARRDPSISITGLRLSFIQTHDTYISELRATWSDPALNSFTLWAYVDARDVASVCRLALEHTTPRFEALNIAAADTLMRELTLTWCTLPTRGSGGWPMTSRDPCPSLTAAGPPRSWAGPPQYSWEQVLTPK